MAARDFGMDAWMNRYRSFAEGVVVMVSPVLLALALAKVNLTQKEHGRAVPIFMLVVAGATLIAGIGPFILCSFYKFWWRESNGNGRPQSPHTVTKFLAPISSICLVVLACWVMSLIIIYNKWVYPVIVLCLIVRSVMYCRGNDAPPQDQDPTAGDREYYTKLENSLEFLAGITALLFVGLEGLALEGQIERDKGVQHRLTKPMAASFSASVVGVCLMLVATVPPRSSISFLTEAFDIVMDIAVSLVIFFIMYPLMKLRALIVMAPGFLCLLMYAFYIAVGRGNAIADEERNVSGGSSSNRGAGRGTNHDEECKPASLELTKITFAGFLAVSIPKITKDSVNVSTECFMHFAAAAIVSGLVWRLLTHLRSDKVKATADLASVFTHFCIVIATVPFTIMAGEALP